MTHLNTHLAGWYTPIETFVRLNFGVAGFNFRGYSIGIGSL